MTLYLQPDGMILVNTFEKPFGDECGEGVWSKLSETTSDILKGNIVALASFRGDSTYSTLLLFQICM